MKYTQYNKTPHPVQRIPVWKHAQKFKWHDDVIKWKHFPRNWPFVRGIHRSREPPTQRPVTRSVWWEDWWDRIHLLDLLLYSMWCDLFCCFCLFVCFYLVFFVFVFFSFCFVCFFTNKKTTNFGNMKRVTGVVFVSNTFAIPFLCTYIILKASSCLTSCVIFATRASIVCMDTGTPDTIRVSLAVTIRFFDISINGYTPTFVSTSAMFATGNASWRRRDSGLHAY